MNQSSDTVNVTDSFAKYAIAHEAGHAVVGQFVRIGAPKNIAFHLCRGSDGRLYLGDFATALLFPSDDQIAQLPESVKNCLCYTLAAGLALSSADSLSPTKTTVWIQTEHGSENSRLNPSIVLFPQLLRLSNKNSALIKRSFRSAR
jgi:hypothetical protein